MIKSDKIYSNPSIKFMKFDIFSIFYHLLFFLFERQKEMNPKYFKCILFKCTQEKGESILRCMQNKSFQFHHLAYLIYTYWKQIQFRENAFYILSFSDILFWEISSNDDLQTLTFFYNFFLNENLVSEHLELYV